jgi:phospholipid/cholesterol/gamma-HCH transport system permease protein
VEPYSRNRYGMLARNAFEALMASSIKIAPPPGVTVTHSADTLTLHLSGEWRMRHKGAATAAALSAIDAPPKPHRVAFESSDLGEWDTALLTFLERVSDSCRTRGIEVDRAGLPPGVQRLLDLAEAVPEKKDARAAESRESFLTRIGAMTIEVSRSLDEFLDFFGRVMVAFWRLFRGKARFRTSDLMIAIQDCGANALGIVTLISYLVGVILAFMGAVQLQQFGAQLYVADLVAIGVTRDMGAIMTAIIMAGRTGAAFAAALGTMKVTQEIDALATMGISPLEFLVLPRVLALVLMMPLLCLYSDFVAILGGTTIGVGMLGINFTVFIREAAHATTMTYVLGGLFKGTVYGALIAVSGCLRGFQCGNSSSAVGDAATQAVVMSIVLIVSACGVFAVVFNILGI